MGINGNVLIQKDEGGKKHHPEIAFMQRLNINTSIAGNKNASIAGDMLAVNVDLFVSCTRQGSLSIPAKETRPS